jgi:hypothetical protein
MLPTESRFGHLSTVRARRLHAYMSYWTCSRPLQLPLSPPLLRVPHLYAKSNDGNPLVDGRWGRVEGQEGAERSDK